MFGNCKLGKNMFKLANAVNATQFITNMLAFQPPSKYLYKMKKPEDPEENTICGQCFDIKYEKMDFVHEYSSEVSFPWIEQQGYFIHREKRKSANSKQNGKNRKKSEDLIYNKKIAVLVIKNKFAKNNIILSHGNSSSLGTIYPFLIDMSTQLKSNIIAYDYQSYGESQGKACEASIYNDIENVLEFAKNLNSLKLKNQKHENNFILIGHSLGSAPSVHIASQTSCFYNIIRAMILISPISSIKKMMDRVKNPKSSCNIGLEKSDIFCNIKKIQEVNFPVFIIHGQKDTLIPCWQSEEMLKYIKIKHEWFPKNGDHNNILTKYRTKFFIKCNLFLDNLFCFENRKVNNSKNYSLDSNGFKFLNNGTFHNNYYSDNVCLINGNCNGNKQNFPSISNYNNIINPPFQYSNKRTNSNDRASYSSLKFADCNNYYNNTDKFSGLKCQAYENYIDNIEDENECSYDNTNQSNIYSFNDCCEDKLSENYVDYNKLSQNFPFTKNINLNFENGIISERTSQLSEYTNGNRISSNLKSSGNLDDLYCRNSFEKITEETIKEYCMQNTERHYEQVHTSQENGFKFCQAKNDHRLMFEINKLNANGKEFN